MDQISNTSQKPNKKFQTKLLIFHFISYWSSFKIWNLRSVFSVFFLLGVLQLSAHVVELLPANPSPTDSVSLLLQNRKYMSHTFTNGILNIQTNHGLFRFYFYNPKMIRVINFPTGKVEPDSSVAVIIKATEILEK